MSDDATSAGPKVRIFLVDYCAIVRRGLRLLLSLEPDMEVCGEAESVGGAAPGIAEARPEVAILGVSSGQGSGLELIRQLRDCRPRLKILVFSMRPESLYGQQARLAGADRYLEREDGPQELVGAIRLILRGESLGTPTRGCQKGGRHPRRVIQRPPEIIDSKTNHR
jgi:DNA-binding NarL/FixJ family response regulator